MLTYYMSVNSQLAQFTSQIKGYQPAVAPTYAQPEKINEQDKHTGFYCLKCKKNVYPAVYNSTETHNKKKQIQAVCKDCNKPIRRFIKFSKE